MSDPPDDRDEERPADRASSGRAALFDRLISGGRSTGTRLARPTSVKRAVEQLDDRERRYSFIASAAAVVFGVMIYLLESQHPKPLTKGQLAPLTTLILGLAFGALLFGATLWGRRALVGFAALFTGFIFSNVTVVAALPFLALAGWLLYHSYRVQKEAAAVARTARAESSGPRASTGKTATARSKPSPKANPKKGPAGPEANKRYTPKRPAPPPPKPSRRERKAKASE